MNTKIEQPTLDSFCNGAATILGLESALSGKPVDPDWVKKIALWKTGLFRIVVMGEIKKGKSSFVNALLGHKDLVPVCSDVATSTIFKICYGEKVGYKVFFHKTSGKAPVEIDSAQLSAYGTEDGNPGNEKQVEFIQVFCPSPILKSGLVVIDTPGLGGLFKQHKRITYEYVPKADAVFLVTDSVESPIGQAEIDLLSDLKKVTKHIFFVQTKSRLVDADAREARKSNNLSILTSQADFDKDKIKYFVVDSQTKFAADEEKDLKKLERSGFKDVAEFVNGYIRPNVHRLLMARATAELRPKIDIIAREFDAQSAVLRTKTEEERTALVQTLKDEQKEIDKWERTGKAEIKEKIEVGLSRIRKDAIERLDQFDPNGGALILEIEQSLNQIDSMDEIQANVDGIQASLPNALAEKLHEICSDIQRETAKLLCDASNAAKVDVSEMENAADNVSLSISRVHQDLVVDTKFNKARTIMYGGMAGAGIGSTIGGIIGGCIGFCCGGVGAIPGVEIGAALGGLLGQPVGYVAAHADQKTRQLDGARKMAVSLVSKWLSSCYKSMSRAISDQFETIRRYVGHAIDEAIVSEREARSSRIAELKQMGQRSSEEIIAKTAELQKHQQQFMQAMSDMGLSPEQKRA